jgi:AcrR family transcriptional regulator
MIVQEALDPRIRRTRGALQSALGALLRKKEFDKISVGDIAEEAQLNRATFYDHFPDKFALLESFVSTRFNELLTERGVIFDGGCASALTAIVLGVCDFVASAPRCECDRQRQMEPHFESAVISVVRKMLLTGLEQHPAGPSVPPKMIASAASGAIYGAVKEWFYTPNRCSSEEILPLILALAVPVLAPKLEAVASA